mmetsp:Transcript_41065/g.64132  ORF Transcript_41065/g.64132 Transcript_41065/m.64132 type:complete len:87 (-) Transcript_41065:1145-1405(-)
MADFTTVRHSIFKIRELDQFKAARNAPLTCKICGVQDAKYYCETCSAVSVGKIFAVCGPGSGKDRRQCMSYHVQDEICSLVPIGSR